MAPGKKKQSSGVATVDPRSVTPAHLAIGQRLRAARIKADFTQAELGTKLGVSFQQIQKYEKGANRIDISRLIQIAKVLNVELSEITGHHNGKHATSEATIDFESVLATREGVSIIRSMIEMTQSQRQFLVDIARRIPHLAADAE